MPLTRPWGPDVRDISIIEVEVTDSDGATGYGFSWTPSIGATAVKALIDDDITSFALGREAASRRWSEAWTHLHEAGGGGITTIALAGVDLGLWDLAARRESVSVTEFLGRAHRSLDTYGSGVNLHYPLAELVAQAERWAAAGFPAIKVKVGKPELAEDLDRLQAVREVIGPDVELMVDANQRWTLPQAVAAAHAFRPLDLTWLEEPLRADDLRGHVELKRETGVRIAVGENLHTEYRFAEFIDAGAADVLQPNVIRVGGITPALRIAELVQSADKELAFHLLPELSAQLAFAVAKPTRIEVVESAGFAELGALAEPTGLEFARGRVTGGPTLGTGIRFS
ncbi:mandelate racemase/muconate lactonizing enzyme family protein [Gryllotalpicola protaetiae]|uniref:Mandelate racemase/muconate lactonizing enzyme family protein n=1 Tax=Gryllotalpicola protaetiae TaxID=2419771 RepID=A0A387BM13_9MICO|nr:mandelate racemase/muconate lactonizing enzyme family protein [Gryllotalpicola protaetiae]